MHLNLGSWAQQLENLTYAVLWNVATFLDKLIYKYSPFWMMALYLVANYRDISWSPGGQV